MTIKPDRFIALAKEIGGYAKVKPYRVDSPSIGCIPQRSNMKEFRTAAVNGGFETFVLPGAPLHLSGPPDNIIIGVDYFLELKEGTFDQLYALHNATALGVLKYEGVCQAYAYVGFHLDKELAVKIWINDSFEKILQPIRGLEGKSLEYGIREFFSAVANSRENR